MANEFVQIGDSIDYTPGSDTAAGTVVVQDALLGVTVADLKANELGALRVEGVFNLAKAGGGGVTFAAGANVYWDVSGETAVAASGAGIVLAGSATKAAADADTYVQCKLVHPNTVG